MYSSLDESAHASMLLGVGRGEDLAESTVCLRFRLIWDWRTTDVMRVYVDGGKMMFNVKKMMTTSPTRDASPGHVD